MTERFSARAFWGPRAEDVEACASHVATCIERLGRRVPELARWGWIEYGPGETHRFIPLRDVAADLRERLLDGRARDRDKRVIEWMGFNAHLATSGEDEKAELDVHAGLTMHGHNACILKPAAGALGESAVACGYLLELVENWDAEHGLVSAWPLDRLLGVDDQTDPIGWITFLAASRGPIPSLPSPVRVEPVPRRGSLIILSPEPFDAENTNHVDTAMRVFDILNDHGLLRCAWAPPIRGAP